ncbi:MAG: hypothetical protein U0232_13385 [Thermomicrobiales bacterium]
MMLTSTGPVTMIAAVGDLAAVGLAVAAGEGIDGMGSMVGVAVAAAIGGAVAARGAVAGTVGGRVLLAAVGVAVMSPVETGTAPEPHPASRIAVTLQRTMPWRRQ